MRRNRAKYDPDYVPFITAVRMMEYLARYPYVRGSFFDGLLGICKNTRNYHLNLLFNNRYLYKPPGQGNGYNSLNDTHIYANEQHMMMICDMLQSIEIGLKGTDCTFITQSEILDKVTAKDPLKFPATIVWNGKPYQTYGKPDAIFGIRYPNGKTRLFNGVTWTLKPKVLEQPQLTRDLHELIDGECVRLN